MPLVLRAGPYTVFFYSADGVEPPHVHVRRDSAVAKYWLAPVRLGYSRGFAPRELREAQRLIAAHETQIVEAWDEHFGG
jgi:hypothetical protein